MLQELFRARRELRHQPVDELPEPIGDDPACLASPRVFVRHAAPCPVHDFFVSQSRSRNGGKAFRIFQDPVNLRWIFDGGSEPGTIASCQLLAAADLLTMRTTMVDETSLRTLASRRLWLSNNCYDLTAAAEMRAISLRVSGEATETEHRAERSPRP